MRNNKNKHSGGVTCSACNAILFLQTAKIKMAFSLVATSGNIDFDFDFNEKSHYCIGKHIRYFLIQQAACLIV